MLKAIELNARIPYATEDELQYLHDLAAQEKPKLVVMLGAGPGVMMLAVAEGYDDALALVVIDNGEMWTLAAHMNDAGFGHNFIPVKGDSSQEAYKFDGIDLLIVDADHTFDGVRKDKIAWLPKIAPGGYVFFHDYDATGTQFEASEHYDGVKLAVDNFMPRDIFNQATRVGTAIVFRRSNDTL